MAKKATTKKVAKKAAKKKPTKKVAKKSDKKKTPPKELQSRDPMDPNFNFIPIIKESLALVEARSKNKSTSFMSYAEIQNSMLPFRHFALQWLFGSYGIPSASVVDIIGAEHLGKSTNLMTWMGWAQLSSAAVLLQLSESKPLTPARVKRCLSTDPEKAQFMLDRISVEKIHSLDHSVEAMERWVELMRVGDKAAGIEPLFPNKKKVPLVIGIDSWSKFMNKAEAAGFYDYGDNMSDAKKKKLKAVGEASNLGHAQHAAAWCRRLPYWLVENNVTVILVHHQNDKIDMGAQGLSSFMPEDTAALYNKTKIGGRALNQNASMQVIIARKGLYKDRAKNNIGITIKMRADKNSYGPNNRVIEYNLITEINRDTDNYLQPALDYDEFMCNMFVTKKILGTTVSDKMFSSKAMGIQGATAAEFSAAFHSNLKLIADVGKALNITGYSDIVDQIQAEMVKPSVEITTISETEGDPSQGEAVPPPPPLESVGDESDKVPEPPPPLPEKALEVGEMPDASSNKV